MRSQLIEDYRKSLYESYYDDIEDTLLACMSAGVPASHISLYGPKIEIEDYTARLTGGIVFILPMERQFTTIKRL